MDLRKFTLLEALKTGSLHGGEMRLYRRGKLPGLFAQRNRLNAELATQAVREGLLEVTRLEPAGKTSIEWVRVTPKGLDLLLAGESPARALEGLRDALAANQQGLPIWADRLNARIDDLVKTIGAEVESMRGQLEQMSARVTQAIDRLEVDRPEAPSTPVPWALETLQFLDQRQDVGLGPRCPLADLFSTLKEKHDTLTIRDFHAGLRLLSDSKLIALLPSAGNDDAPGPEYAILDGPAVYYYLARAG